MKTRQRDVSHRMGRFSGVVGNYMQPAELVDIGRELWSAAESWQVEMARRLGVHHTTIYRWERGQVAIIGPAALALRLLLEKHRATKGKPAGSGGVEPAG